MASAACKRKETGEIRFFPLRENPSFSGRKCSASASSASSSSTTESDQWRQCGSDRMVKNELDAARALADLSQMAPIEARGQDEKWGNKGRRSRKRAVEELKVVLEQGKDDLPGPRPAPGLDVLSSKLPKPLDPIQNQPLEVYQWRKKVCQHIERKSGQVDSTFPKSCPNRSRTGMSFCRGKSKQNLSEAEKEAKRLRRVLANRESARQTILRRQEKELVMKEYQLLKDRNKYLKFQVAKTIKGESAAGIKTESEETPFEAISTHGETLLSMQLQSPAYNRSAFMPFFWPSLYPLQTHPFPQNTTESKDLAATYMAHRWGSGHDPICMPRMRSNMLPYPWFFPPLHHWCGPYPCDPHTCKENDENSVEGQCNMGRSSISRGKMKKASFLIDGWGMSISTEANTKRENASNNIIEGESQTLEHYTKSMVNKLNTINALQPTSTVKCESVLETNLNFKEAVSSGKLQETSIYQSRKSVDPSTAAEARKRRKELTKLKNHHNRQFQLPS
ncbi:uncharacterized protein LOC131234445 isoform X2 [Magnolia sinica]|uniref:uncharacterized protein LOC131234445 isoform X2 n=1 Tax=Magnolia sinica TaxID=86752 RepID=UPI00265B25B9|nr:uncharacterized protein LOC131234445 isoform X2 [Magnolia sinica]